MDMHGEGPEINQNSLFVPVLDVKFYKINSDSKFIEIHQKRL
jgi:hypothetical protein